MSKKVVDVSKATLIEWVNSTREGSSAFHHTLANKNCTNIETYFEQDHLSCDENYRGLQVLTIAEQLEYPGDGNWERSDVQVILRNRTEAELQVQDLAMIVRKLLAHVPDEVPFKAKAKDYLARKGLAGSILRFKDTVDA